MATSATGIQNTLTSLQNDTNQVNFQQDQTELGSSNLSSTDFMQLLVAQLQYQDPDNPSDTNQMVSQEASLTETQDIQGLETYQASSTAYGMIGRQVQLTSSSSTADGITSTPTTVTGIVQSVNLNSDGTASVNVNGTVYPMSDITQVSGASSGS